MAMKSDDLAEFDPETLCWIGTIPYFLLKPLLASRQHPSGLHRLDDVLRLLRRVKRHLLSLRNSSLGSAAVVLFPNFDKIGLVYEEQRQRRLALDASDDPVRNADGKGGTLASAANATSTAMGGMPADDSRASNSNGAVRAMDERAVSIALEIANNAKNGKLPTAEEFAAIVSSSENPEVTMRVLAQLDNIPHTVAGVERVFDLGGKCRFPRSLTSSQRFIVTLGGFANINPSSVEAYVMSVEGQIDNELARHYFKRSRRYRVLLEGGTDDSKLRQLALWDFQVRATVIASIQTGQQEIFALTLLNVEDLEGLRSLASERLHQIQLALNLRGED
jgi:hypothetical protein